MKQLKRSRKIILEKKKNSYNNNNNNYAMYVYRLLND